MKVRKMILVSGIIMGVCAMLLGCTTRLIDFSIISSKNVNINAKRGPKTSGQDCAYFIILFPTGVPNMEEACDRAIEAAGPDYDALENGVLYSKQLILPFFAKTCYVIEGRAINTRATDGNAGTGIMYHSSALSNP